MVTELGEYERETIYGFGFLGIGRGVMIFGVGLIDAMMGFMIN